RNRSKSKTRSLSRSRSRTRDRARSSVARRSRTRSRSPAKDITTTNGDEKIEVKNEMSTSTPPPKDAEMRSASRREPNSSVVFHALPRHDKDLPLDAMEGKPLTKEDKWQDDEHLVHPPASNDPKGIVGRLQKDLEEEDKRINISKTDLDKR
ncbi:4809_t:CDS:2, partial [Entrophospora sp. SA101]